LSREGRFALALGVVYLASRLYGLTALPIFLDETTHIRWAVEIAEGEKWQRPWDYGKGLSIFLNALLFPWAFDHYLWASRALTVGFGALSLFAGLAAGRRLFDAPTARLFGLLYLACPFVLLYDRLALTDSPMAALAALVLVLSIRLGDDPRPRRALLLGLALVLTVFTKATALLVVGTPLAALVLLGPLERRRLTAFALAVGTALVVLALPVHRFLAITATVPLAVGHRQVDLPTRLSDNLPLALSWLAGIDIARGRNLLLPGLGYLSLPVALLALAGLVLGLRRRDRAAPFLACLVAVPVLAFAAVSTLWFPRYLVFVAVPALLLAARGFLLLAGWLPFAVRACLLLLALLPALGLDRDILRAPERAALPAIDRDQFVLGWPSGYGTDGTVAFVREELRQQPRGLTVVAHVHARRTTWLALGLEFAREPRVDLRDLDLTRPGNLNLLAAWSQAKPTLLVLSPVGPAHARPEPLTWAHLGRLVFRSCKPDGKLCDETYRLGNGARPVP
jgi:4-amino-4-deoxy-L-arabinose transferase-like glycosyltransferase